MKMNMINKDLAFQDLRLFKRFCDVNQIVFWLDWGTLLGAVREGKFIPWEQDIDLGFHKEELDEVISQKDFLNKIGFRLFKKPDGYALVHKGLTSKMDLGCYIIKDNFAYQTCAEYNKFGELCDMLLFILNEEDADFKYETILSRDLLKKIIKVVHYLPYKQTYQTLINYIQRKCGIRKTVLIKSPKTYFDSFEKITFYGQEFNTPNNPQKYLESLYGSDWMIPKNWIENKDINKWNEFHNIERS